MGSEKKQRRCISSLRPINQDPTKTLNWGYRSPNGGDSSPDRGYLIRGLGTVMSLDQSIPATLSLGRCVFQLSCEDANKKMNDAEFSSNKGIVLAPSVRK